MTTYVYEIIPTKAGETPRYVEIKQGMKDAPLTTHPETGEAIRRVIFGGYGALSKGERQRDRIRRRVWVRAERLSLASGREREERERMSG
jgi:hypothetical protein